MKNRLNSVVALAGILLSLCKIEGAEDIGKYSSASPKRIRAETRILSVSHIEKERELACALIDSYGYKFDNKTVMDVLPRLLLDKSSEVKLTALNTVETLADAGDLYEAGSIATMEYLMPYVQQLVDDRDPGLNNDRELIRRVLRRVKDVIRYKDRRQDPKIWMYQPRSTRRGRRDQPLRVCGQ